MRPAIKTIVLILSLSILTNCSTNKKSFSPEQAKSIAKEAYIFGFPIVMNYKTMYAYTLDKNSPEYKGDFNQFGCTANVYTPEDKAIVTPNSDTPYCMGFAYIGNDPVVIAVPEMEEDRFYHIQLVDMYTHNYAYIGSLSTGNEAGQFLVATQAWDGEVPEGIKEVIRCETDYFFLLNRTQLFGPDDLDRMREIQAEYTIQSLSAFNGQEETAPVIPAIPKWNEGDQFSAYMFNYLDPWLQQLNPVEDDKAIFERFKTIGLGTGTFNLDDFDDEIKTAIEEGVKEALAEMNAFITNNADPLASTRMFGTREFLKKTAKEFYDLDRPDMVRWAAAHIGLYGNSGAEAIYPAYYTDASGAPLDASENKYTMTFKEEDFSPVRSFWSLTMYDGKTQLLIENPIDRYLLNSPMLDDFVRNEDGSITLYIQKDSPGAELEPNWLPAPDGPFYTVLRLYGPEPEILEGRWETPEIIKK